MPRCMFFAIAALFTAPVFAQPLMPDAATPSPEMPPQQRIAQFHHDQINLLGLRGDAHSLLAAALMAQVDANDPSRPAALKTPALLARAQKADDVDTLVWWVSAALDCGGKAKSCPREETLAALEKSDADNAATWLWALHQAQMSGADAKARAALTSAANAARFDDYFGALTAMLYQAADILPVDEAILRASEQPGVSAAGFKLTYAAGIAIGVRHPYLEALDTVCKKATSDSGIAQDCIDVAQKMADSGSLFVRSAGNNLLLKLAPSGATHDTAAAQARTLAWRMLNIGTVAVNLADDSRVAGIYVNSLRATGREIDAVDAVLQNQRFALDPPAGWEPGSAAQP